MNNSISSSISLFYFQLNNTFLIAIFLCPNWRRSDELNHRWESRIIILMLINRYSVASMKFVVEEKNSLFIFFTVSAVCGAESFFEAGFWLNICKHRSPKFRINCQNGGIFFITSKCWPRLIAVVKTAKFDLFWFTCSKIQPLKIHIPGKYLEPQFKFTSSYKKLPLTFPTHLH